MYSFRGAGTDGKKSCILGIVIIIEISKRPSDNNTGKTLGDTAAKVR
jgi:hypothetical protein